MKTWQTPKANEIKMDAEISSYQDDSQDPTRDPLFVSNESPRETDGERKLPRA